MVRHLNDVLISPRRNPCYLPAIFISLHFSLSLSLSLSLSCLLYFGILYFITLAFLLEERAALLSFLPSFFFSFFLSPSPPRSSCYLRRICEPLAPGAISASFFFSSFLSSSSSVPSSPSTHLSASFLDISSTTALLLITTSLQVRPVTLLPVSPGYLTLRKMAKTTDCQTYNVAPLFQSSILPSTKW